MSSEFYINCIENGIWIIWAVKRGPEQHDNPASIRDIWDFITGSKHVNGRQVWRNSVSCSAFSIKGSYKIQHPHFIQLLEKELVRPKWTVDNTFCFISYPRKKSHNHSVREWKDNWSFTTWTQTVERHCLEEDIYYTVRKVSKELWNWFARQH